MGTENEEVPEGLIPMEEYKILLEVGWKFCGEQSLMQSPIPIPNRKSYWRVCFASLPHSLGTRIRQDDFYGSTGMLGLQPQLGKALEGKFAGEAAFNRVPRVMKRPFQPTCWCSVPFSTGLDALVENPWDQAFLKDMGMKKAAWPILPRAQQPGDGAPGP